ncbi:hypothetical protein D0Z07_3470 [Hyphodiscus hymeniophilus]|uniref:EGF-like domain-containing protein n=1 Tax=Hyphodiscus hymeniophilus TaxID=353542 RepID=A0A9P6VMG0_9HELO|nr:hypothetical protein D0Z07_3470 [Hyphodiscus hymeniophilus]
MSQQQWEKASGGGGSVRRARQRMEAGLPPEIQQTPQQKRYEPSTQARSPPEKRPRQQMPQALQGQGPIGVAISRPTQVPQWPLAGKIETARDQNNNQQYQPPTGRGIPPQRPPRPSHVPSMLDASRLQEHTPSFQYMPQPNQMDQNHERGQRYPEDEMTSPGVTSPMNQSSRPSTISSVGTIPDFPIPVPQPPGPPRKSANLGPPPSARRGASSYYSQISYVSPIPEESPRTQPSHGSYASSAAMPTSWGSDSPGYEFDDEDEYARYIQEKSHGNEVIEEGRESRESTMDDSDDRGLIRSASLGKRAKPSMVTTKSVERIEMQRPTPQPQQKSKGERMGVLAGGTTGVSSAAALTTERSIEGHRETVWPMIGNPDSPLAGGTGLIDKSTSSSENEVPRVSKGVARDIAAPMPSGPGATDMLGVYNAASSLQPPGTTPSRTPSPGFNRLSAIRRPPRLNIDAVREAEARGSLTSLPDLIRRATRLASMMDRGKRPASRLNDLSDFPSDFDLARDKEMGITSDGNRQSGLSNMLAAFPPPGLATPTRGNTPRPQSSWPVINRSGSDSDFETPRRKRRCCGLPCWGFLLALLILLVIIAAAVVVPLELLVIQKPKTASAVTALQACSRNSATACQNRGTSSLSTGNCSCVCINGFTGSTCSVFGASGCTTTTLSTDPTFTNVTLGDSIPRLITAAQANFSIPLSDSVILARFNSASLSCVTENALVTFDGESQRVGTAEDAVHPTSTASSASASSTTPSNKLRRDAASSSTSSAAIAAATVNGIIYDPSSVPTPAAASSAAAASSTSSASASQTSSEAEFTITEEVLDFSRVAVLFVLQQESLDSAVTAQTELQKFFDQGTSTNVVAQNISMGNGNVANLVNFSIDLGNGSVGSTNASVTKRTLTGKRSIQLWTVHT